MRVSRVRPSSSTPISGTPALVSGSGAGWATAAIVGRGEGTAEGPLTASRLKVSQVRALALVIHQDSDNFSDVPKPLGGGGARIACGTLEKSKT